MSKKLHLGCGNKHLDGWINVDSLEWTKADQIVDLTKFPWPWEDNSIDEIYSHHVFEHLPDTLSVMMECHRILKKGGTVETIVPYALNTLYFQDPSHCRPWTDVTVYYFVNGPPYDHKYTPKGFDLVFVNLRNQVEDAPPTRLNRILRDMIPNKLRMTLRYILLGMYDEVHFKLKKPE
jgi:SAM-dependent methyltransferase